MFNHKCITIFLGALIFAAPVTAMEQSNNAGSKAQYVVRLAQENKGAVALTAVGAAVAVGLYAYLRPIDYNTQETAFFKLGDITGFDIRNQTHGSVILKKKDRNDIKVIFKKIAANKNEYKNLITIVEAVKSTNHRLTNDRLIVQASTYNPYSGGKVDCIVEYPRNKDFNWFGDTANWHHQ